ncbi:MAG TPA: tetratricopeptide repeat protein [Anaerolineales bacterium]|nr:tetratricopeptide repeat protein [Anaerolineales bacterium]
MTMTCLSITGESPSIEPFEDRIDILFHELELATKWQRPSVLLAIYNSECVRSDADIALENRLHNLGQSAYHIKIRSQKSADVSLLISELANSENVVFFVEGLRGSSEQDRSSYRILNKSREFFIEKSIRMVLWLTEEEAIDLAHYAPDYWSFRHRVIEFTDPPRTEQAASPMLESAWQGMGEFSEADEDLDAKIALRVALLTDLPEGHESTSARANLLLTLGMLHWRRGDYEKSAQFLNTALDLAAGLEDASFEALCFNALALVQTDLGRFEQAVLAYQNAIKLAPEQITPWNNLGNLYRKLGRHTEALQAFQKSVEQNDADAVGWNGLGNLYRELGRNDDAIYAFLKATESSPSYAPSWSGLGDAYLAVGQLDKAASAHLKAIEIDRQSAGSWFALGDIYNLQGRNGDASMAYQTVIELDSKNAQAWNKLGDLHFSAGAYQEAQLAYQSAIDSDQSSSLAYGNLASIHVQKGSFTEALPLLQKAIELSEENPEKAMYWNRMGDVYRHLNDYAHAMAAYRNADALDPQKTAYPTGSSPDRPDMQLPPTEGLPSQPVSNFKLRSMPVELPAPGPAAARETCPARPQPAGGAGLPVSIGPAPEFIGWLDGLAAAMTDFHRRRLSFTAGSAPLASDDPLEQVEETLKLNFVQPEAAFPVYTKDQPDWQDTGPGAEPFAGLSASELFPDPDTQTTDQAGQKEPGRRARRADGPVEEENARLWNELGSIYLNTGAYAEAINAFKRAIELDRSYGWSYHNLAALYSRQGQYKDAVKLYQKGLQYLRDARDQALVWNRLGDTYRHMNQQNRAAAAYKKAMELDPGNVSILTRARFSLLGNCRA